MFEKPEEGHGNGTGAAAAVRSRCISRLENVTAMKGSSNTVFFAVGNCHKLRTAHATGTGMAQLVSDSGPPCSVETHRRRIELESQNKRTRPTRVRARSLHFLGRISPISSPFFLVFCAFSPARRDGSNEPQAGTQGQETAGTGVQTAGNTVSAV